MKKWFILIISILVSNVGVIAHASEYRLGNNVIPIEQFVDLKLDPSIDDFKGFTQINIKVIESAYYLDMNGLELSINDVKLIGDKHTQKLSVELRNHGIIRFKSNAEILPGLYSLSVKFSGRYNKNSVGIYKTADQGDNYLFTQFQMTDARRAFPVFDEPEFKIPFKLTISAPKDESVFSNTREYKTLLHNGWVTHYFEKTKPMPSYIVALAVGPFETMDIEGLSVPGRIITTKGKLTQGKFSAKMIPEILTYLENYFDMKYPYDKADFLAVPEYAYGAMENAGLSAYREDILLLDSANTNVSLKTTTTMVLAHEMAHMWYGDLVTMKWWEDLWLNEAFASWMARKTVNELYPEYEYELSLPQTHALVADSASTSKPIRKTINTETDVQDGLYLNYTKGSTLMEMVEQWVGEDKFQKGIRNYINKFSWKNTQASDLWGSLTEASGKDVKSVLTGFTGSPGFPLISVKTDGNKATLQQNRFVNKGETVKNYIWTVPVSLKYGKGNKVATVNVLMTDQEKIVELEFDPDWVFPDNNALGYYRWELTTELLSKLSNVSNEKLTVKERISFVNNNDALLNAGIMTGAEYLLAMGEAISDEHPTVVKTALTGIMKVANPFVDENNESQWTKYVSKTIALAIQRFGLTNKSGEKDNVSELRASLLKHMAIEGKDEKIIEKSAEKAKLYLKKSDQVSPELAATYLRIAAYYADHDLYNKIVSSFNKVTDPRERTNLIMSLGSFAEESIQRKSLDLMLTNENITASDMQYLLSYNRMGGERQKVLQDWTLKNFGKLMNKVPPYLESSIPLLIGASCDQSSLNEVTAFFSRAKNKISGIDRTMAKLKAHVQGCINLKAREKESVTTFLSNF